MDRNQSRIKVILAFTLLFLGPLLVVAANLYTSASLSRRWVPSGASIRFHDPALFQTGDCAPPVGEVLSRIENLRTRPDEETSEVSERMERLFQEDQGRVPPSQSAVERRSEILGYLERGEILSPRDLHTASVIFQHGNCAEHFLFANRLADAAHQAGYAPANWIYAASFDRYQMSQGEPQHYGTQYIY